MSWKSLLAAAALWSGVSAFAGAEQAWVRARVPHAEVLSNGTDAQAQQAAERIEGAHRALKALFPTLPDPETAPPVVIAFADERGFAAFTPADHDEPERVDGFILGGPERTYLVVNLASEREDPFDTLAHEYTHYVLNAVLPAQPPWLGEGVADFVANATAGPGGILFGRPQDAYAARLRGSARGAAMPLRDLLAVGYLSSTYRGGAGREAFYARSWALVHWVVAGGHGGAAGLLAYARAMADGEDAARAFERVFGMTIDAAEASVAAHLAGELLPSISLPSGGGTFPSAQLEIASARDVERHLADVATRAGRAKDAAALVARAETAAEAAPDGARALLRAAQRQLTAISSRGSVPSDAETARAVALLERAVAADPDLADAADLLARLSPTPVAHRIALLRRAVARQPERAELAFTLAGLHLKRNDLAEAGRVLRRARERTRDDAHRFLAGHLLARVAAMQSGVVETRGILEAVECLAGGALAFRLRAAGGVVRLVAASPKDLFLYDAEGETYERELTCGPSSVPVLARYHAAPTAEGYALVSLSFESAPAR